MKITIEGMTFESNEADPLEEQHKQMQEFLAAAKTIVANRPSGPVAPLAPLYPGMPWPNQPFYIPQIWSTGVQQ